MAATEHSVNHNARMTVIRRAMVVLLAASPTRPVTDRPFLPEGSWPETVASPFFVTVDSRAEGCLLVQGRWTNPLVSRTFVQLEAPRDSTRVAKLERWAASRARAGSTPTVRRWRRTGDAALYHDARGRPAEGAIGGTLQRLAKVLGVPVTELLG